MEELPKPRAKRKKIVRKDINSPDYVKSRMASPEMLALRMAGLKKRREANPDWRGRAKGQPDGVRKKDWLIIKEKAAAKAERAIEIMAEKKIWEADNDVSSKAMKAAIEILEAPGEHRNKLAAAKVILDFTQTKPVVKSETTLKTAEEFLSSLIEGEDEPKP